MLIIKIFGLLILVFNLAGLAFLLFVGTLFLWRKYILDEEPDQAAEPVAAKKKPDIMNDDIIVDEDDLLKDMDLSDLDDLDLDDFD